VESAWIDVPSVIGWMRPVIVVPASTFAGLSPEQFDAILAHELAHIRRHDYFVNALQSVLEVLLFYHPAVWWVSHQVRLEREHCCDDIAVEVCGDRVAYANALACLEERRATAAFAMGATGGHLLTRVRRLIRRTPAAPNRRSAWAAIAATCALVALGLTTYDSRPLLARPSASVASVSTLAATPTSDPPKTTSTAPTPTRVPRNAPRAAASSPQVGLVTFNVQVVDPQGGTLPGATVTFGSASGGAAATAVTNASGRAAFASVQPGTYDLTISQPGFQRSISRLDVGPNGLNVRVRLEVGSVSETVTVVSPMPLAAAITPEPTVEPTRAPEPTAQQTGNAPVVVDSLDQSGPVRVGGDIKAPRKIHDVKPAYPDDALASGVAGTVILEAVIARDGSVRDARPVRSVPMLDQAAIDAVRQWRFTPTLLNGAEVEVRMTVTINFRAQ
jgi:bla regulator protein blaR1